jgi:hypothetical protein
MWKSTILSPTFFFLSVYRAYALAASLGCARLPPLLELPRAASGRHPAENPAVGRLRELLTGDAAGEGGGESSVSLVLVVANWDSEVGWLVFC